MTERRPETIERTEEATREVGKLVLDVIQTRRSIREGFTDRPVSNGVISAIIQSGLTAPSSKNAQPWRVHVVHRGEMLDDIADCVQSAKDASRYAPVDPATGEMRQWPSTVAESARTLREVGVGLFVENTAPFSGGKSYLSKHLRQNEGVLLDSYALEMMSLGAMVQNMWLSAQAQGLSGVFIGDIMVAEDDIRKRLEFDGDLTGVLALGYADQNTSDKQIGIDKVVFHTMDEEA